jgi:hypothetical protein
MNDTEKPNDLHHITVNGIPYCVQEGRMFGFYHSPSSPVPTNCAHATKKDAEEGIAECKKQHPEAIYEAVQGSCHHDPFWQTPEGIARIQAEDEMNEMRWNAYSD